MLVADYDSKVMRKGRKSTRGHSMATVGRVSNSQMQIRSHATQKHLHG